MERSPRWPAVAAPEMQGVSERFTVVEDMTNDAVDHHAASQYLLQEVSFFSQFLRSCLMSTHDRDDSARHPSVPLVSLLLSLLHHQTLEREKLGLLSAILVLRAPFLNDELRRRRRRCRAERVQRARGQRVGVGGERLVGGLRGRRGEDGRSRHVGRRRGDALGDADRGCATQVR